MSTKNEAKRADVELAGERELRIERIFEAPRERVWRAMTEPKLLAQWWGRGNELAIERYELERGGHWRFVEKTPHGPQGFEGRFREIVPTERVSMTFEWDGAPGHVVVNTMTLQDLGDRRTKLVAVSLFMTPEDRNAMVKSGMEEGMNQSYQALDRVLAAL